MSDPVKFITEGVLTGLTERISQLEANVAFLARFIRYSESGHTSVNELGYLMALSNRTRRGSEATEETTGSARLDEVLRLMATAGLNGPPARRERAQGVRSGCRSTEETT